MLSVLASLSSLVLLVCPTEGITASGFPGIESVMMTVKFLHKNNFRGRVSYPRESHIYKNCCFFCAPFCLPLWSLNMPSSALSSLWGPVLLLWYVANIVILWLRNTFFHIAQAMDSSPHNHCWADPLYYVSWLWCVYLVQSLHEGCLTWKPQYKTEDQNISLA